MRRGIQMLEQGRLAAVRQSRVRIAAVILLATASASCGDLQRQGQASSYLIVNSLEGAPGSDPATFRGTLPSDVVTIVKDVPTFFNDIGRVKLALAMKDPGAASSPTKPTTANFVTIEQYHVRYIRSDGRNTQGVDVPYAFDGGMTLTIGSGEAS